MSSPILKEPHNRPAEVVVEMHDVKSRSIRRLGYNEETQQLVVHFFDSLPGLRTVYAPVPKELYEGLLKAKAMGQYLDEHIRYTYEFALVHEENLVPPGKDGD